MLTAVQMRQGNVAWPEIYPVAIPGYSGLPFDLRSHLAFNLRRAVAAVSQTATKKEAGSMGHTKTDSGFIGSRAESATGRIILVKLKTLDQVRKMQAKAVRFLRDVVGDDSRADEFEEMSPEEYAEHKRIQIVGDPSRIRIQKRSSVMARAKTPTELREEMASLKAQIRSLEDENSDLQEQVEDLENRLDEIGELACAEDEEQEELSEGQQ